MINITAAIQETGKVRATICSWIKSYRIGESGIGYMSGSHYMVDKDKLVMIISGKQKDLYTILIKEEIQRIRKKGIPVITVRGKTIWLNTVGSTEADISLTPLRYQRRRIEFEEVMFLLSQIGFKPKGSDGSSLIYMLDDSNSGLSKKRTWGI